MLFPWSRLPDEALTLGMRLALGRHAAQELWNQHGWICFIQGLIVAAVAFLILDHLRRGRSE